MTKRLAPPRRLSQIGAREDEHDCPEEADADSSDPREASWMWPGERGPRQQRQTNPAGRDDGSYPPPQIVDLPLLLFECANREFVDAFARFRHLAGIMQHDPVGTPVPRCRRNDETRLAGGLLGVPLRGFEPRFPP
jgi:hypothetical protein